MDKVNKAEIFIGDTSIGILSSFEIGTIDDMCSGGLKPVGFKIPES